MEKDLSLIGAEERSETAFMKKSRTKHKHLVLQPSQKRASSSPSGGRSCASGEEQGEDTVKLRWCLQSCRDASRIQEEVMQNLSQIHQHRLC